MNRRRPISKIDFLSFTVIFSTAQEIHKNRDEPIPDFASDSEARVTSCLVTPFQSFGGKSLYPSFNKKAAILFYLLVKNHCLRNGNKRLAILTLTYFVFINGLELRVSDQLLYCLAKKTAESKNQEKMLREIEMTLRRHLHKQSFLHRTVFSAISIQNTRVSKYRFILRRVKLKEAIIRALPV
ncbi:MAG: Fic family protein [Chitinophagaceae bacterium]|nr:Fic family protein [Chitinophagaceae bacterium]